MTPAEREKYLQEMLDTPLDGERRAADDPQPIAETNDIPATQSEADENATDLVDSQAEEAVARGEVESSDRVIEREQVVVNPDTGERITEKQTLVVPSFDRRQEARINRAQRIVYYIARFITIFLGIQFVLKLFGANPDTGFANFVYTIASPFYFPFSGLFGGDLSSGRNQFDGEALFAIAIYWLFAYLAAKGVAVFIRRSAVREVVSEVK
jgi:hypothetical protein